MSPAQREWKDATRSTRIAAAVAILGILVLSIGGKVIHDRLEARSHANTAQSGR